MINKKGSISAKFLIFNIGLGLSLLGVALVSLISYGLIPTKDAFSFGAIFILCELIISAGVGLMGLSRDIQ